MVHIFNALVDRIADKNIKPQLCGICYPQCHEYHVRLFSKNYTINFMPSQEMVEVRSDRSILRLWLVSYTDIIGDE